MSSFWCSLTYECLVFRYWTVNLFCTWPYGLAHMRTYNNNGIWWWLSQIITCMVISYICDQIWERHHLLMHKDKYLEMCNSVIQWYNYISIMHGAVYMQFSTVVQLSKVFTLQWVANWIAHLFSSMPQVIT